MQSSTSLSRISLSAESIHYQFTFVRYGNLPLHMVTPIYGSPDKSGLKIYVLLGQPYSRIKGKATELGV